MKGVTAGMREKVGLAVAGAMGTMLVLAVTSRYGVGLSPDSVDYIATARHLAAGEGLVTTNGEPLILQPPLYPVILTVVHETVGLDSVDAARYVNAVLFGLVVYLSGRLLFRHLAASRGLAWLGVVLVLVGEPLFEVSSMAWSELLFILFELLFLISAQSYFVASKKWQLWLLACSAAIACLTRYMGVLFIPLGALIILLAGHDSLQRKLRHALLFSLVSTLPIGLWVTRNYALSGTLFGPRASSKFTLAQNVYFVFSTVRDWFLPHWITEHLSIPILLIAAIGFFLVLSAEYYEHKAKDTILELGPIIFFCVIYTVFLLTSSTTVAYDRIDNRLLSPLYVCVTLLLLDQDQAVRAAELRARYNLSLVDAFQVAVALTTNCDAFLTNDIVLKRVTEIDVIVLDETEAG